MILAKRHTGAGRGSKRRIIIPVLLILLLILPALFLSSCGKEPSGTEGKPGILVVATLFPLYDFAREIGGDKVKAVLLLPPGMEPHSFEPRPADLQLLHRADIFLLSHPAMEPWATELLKGISNPKLSVVDTSRGVKLLTLTEEHRHKKEHKTAPGSNPAEDIPTGQIDPHFWLDLDNAAIMVDRIALALAEKKPALASFFRENAERYKMRLAELDGKYKSLLKDCHNRLIVSGGHAAFGYPARKYSLDYVSAYHFSPNAEPKPRDLARIIKLIKKQGLRYIFHEELIQPRIAAALAAETGATLLMLHGAHNITKDEYERGVSFIAIMESNLFNLRKGLSCP